MQLYFENRHEDFIGNEHKYTLYAALNDDPELRVKGYIKYTVLDSVLYVDFIEVDEQHRNAGIGKSLYQELYRLNSTKFMRSGYYTNQGSHVRHGFENS